MQDNNEPVNSTCQIRFQCLIGRRHTDSSYNNVPFIRNITGQHARLSLFQPILLLLLRLWFLDNAKKWASGGLILCSVVVHALGTFRPPFSRSEPESLEQATRRKFPSWCLQILFTSGQGFFSTSSACSPKERLHYYLPVTLHAVLIWSYLSSR